MRIGDYEFMTDCVSKFHNFIYILGWFHHETDTLASVRVIDPNMKDCIARVAIPHGGVSVSLGPDKGFELQIFRDTDVFADDATIEFITTARKRITVKLTELCSDRASRFSTGPLGHTFFDAVNKSGKSKVLDIGGRARSKLDRSLIFSNAECTVIDIIDGDNVDIVGDAHRLSEYFPANSFDAVFSVSVFEHLLMPWKAVVEINRILKVGGIGCIHTHQTLGMHDMPWDFWRFSDTAWDALFNQKTGFKITARALDSEQFVIPFIYRPSKAHAEKSAGFEGSCVLIEKTGPCLVDWDVKVSDAIQTTYPDVDDGQTGALDFH
ncbi:MAG: Methyltransferase type 11 [Hyphomicrobiales bacterium]|nr:Methyltransferase type 11 [Hyphomicrobiales bacterium]